MNRIFRSAVAGFGFLFALASGALAQVSTPSVLGPNTTGCTYAGCALSYTQNGVQSFVKTYKYSSLGNTPAATPTDIFTIAGSASKTIRITKIVVGGLATTAGQLNPLIIRRSAAGTGGTSSNPTAQSRDINNSAATATLTLYTANPTVGTGVGTLDSCRLFLQTATGGAPDICAFTYGVNDDQLTVLRGTTDILAINFNGATVPTGGIVDLDVEWTEEP